MGAASVLIGVAFGATTVSAATGQSTPAVAPQNAPAVVEATNKENNAKFLKQMTDGAIQKLKEKLANATGEEKLSLQAKLADAQKVSDSITALLDRATKNAKAELQVATIKSQLTTATEGDKASLQAKLADAQKSLTDAQKSLTDAEANVTKTQDNIQEAIVAAKLEAAKKDALAKLQADGKLNSDDPDYLSAKEVAAAVKKVEAAKTADEVKAIMADPKKPYSDDVIAAKSALAAAKKAAHETLKKAGITGDIFHKAIDAAKTLEGLKAYVAETLAPYETAEAKKDALAKLQADGKLNPDDPDYLSAEEVAAAVKKVEAAKTADEVKAIMADPKKPYSDDVIAAKSALAAAKKAAHETLKKAGITGDIFHKAIDAAKTLEGLKAYVAETLAAHKTPEPKPEPKPEETTYHFQYDDKKGTSIRQDYEAVNSDVAEMHFKEYASANGLDLDDQYFSYDEASHTFVYKDFESKKGEPEVQPELPVAPMPKTVFHFQYDDKKGTSIRQDYEAVNSDVAEMHFKEYASANGLDLDDQYFSYDEASHTFVYKDFESKKGEPEVQPELPVAPMPKTVFHFQYDDKKGTSIRQDFAAVNKEIAEMHFKEYATESGLVLDDAHFAYNEANQTFVYKDFESEKGEPEVLPAPAVDVLAEAKKVAHEEFTKAGITGKIFHDAIDAAKTVEGLQAYVAETLKAHKTVEPVTPTPAPVVSGETGIGYLNLDMLSDGFTGTLYVPVVGKDVNCKVRLLDDAGKYTNDYVVTDTTVKALASKVVNGVTFYKVAENRWIPAKFAEVLSDKEVAFKGVAKTFVKGHANYAVAMLDADGKYTGKFLKQGSSFKVFAKKVINGHLCYRLGTQAQWVPARFLVF